MEEIGREKERIENMMLVMISSSWTILQIKKVLQMVYLAIMLLLVLPMVCLPNTFAVMSFIKSTSC